MDAQPEIIEQQGLTAKGLPRKKRLGRPKGSTSKATLEQKKEKKNFDQRVLRASNMLINSQLALARGLTYLFKIEKEKIVGPKGGIRWQNKKPELVTKLSELEWYLERLVENDGELNIDHDDPSATYYFLTTKDPNNEAIKDLLNRVHGKPKESLELDVGDNFSLLALARQRLARDVNGDVVALQEDVAQLDAPKIHEHQPMAESNDAQAVDPQSSADNVPTHEASLPNTPAT